jgi:hypothetical protein
MDVMGMRVMRLPLAAALGLAALPLLAGAALADSREQVMLRLPRCSSVSEQRPYLDCYYAAVEPMRTELGLPAAPQSASYAPFFSLGGAPATASTVTQQAFAVREEVLLRLTRCSSIGDTRQYLDCYYAAAQPLRAALNLAPAPQAASYAPLFSLAQVAPRAAAPMVDTRPNLVPQAAYAYASTRATAPPRLAEDEGATRLPLIGSLLGLKSVRVPPEEFGLRTAKAKPGAINVDHIAARITKVETDPDSGSFTLTLDNAQIWKQVLNDDNRQHWRKDIAGTVATVSYGAGQTFNLSVNDGSLYKVERIK